MTETQFYNAWWGIKQRCLNSNNQKYHRYGGRGITVCDEWLDFKEFFKDMYSSYCVHFKKYGRENTSIDRIDNDGNYSKENCRWATRKEQSKNQSKRKHGLTESVVSLLKRIDSKEIKSLEEVKDFIEPFLPRIKSLGVLDKT